MSIARDNIRFQGAGRKVVKAGKKRMQVRSGALMQSLMYPEYFIQAEGERFIVSVFIVKHMRFLDMRIHGNWKIYNRQVWGILYNNALKDIKFNYGEAIKDRVSEALHEAFSGEHGSGSGNSFGEQSSNAKKR